MDAWEISEDELFEIAADSTTYKATPMDDIFGTLLGLSTRAYVITTEDMYLGASSICSPNILESICNETNEDNLVIIPSSIHEIIVLPKNDSQDIDQLKNTVREVNNTCVEENEVLSYSVYTYTRGDDQVQIA